MLEAIGKAGYKAGSDVFIALDVASSELWKDGQYVFKKSGEPTRTPQQMVEMYQDWVKQLPDRLDRGRPRRERLGRLEGADRGARRSTVQLVGDDLFVTNPAILKKGIDEGVANAILVKLNQIGTVTETLDAVAHGPEGRLRDDHLAPLGRDRGHDDRRSRGRAPAPARSRPARRAAATASRSTTSCSASRRSSGARRCSPARARSRT